MADRVAWVLSDGVDTVHLSINPSSADMVGIQRKITAQSSSAPNGINLVFEGKADPQVLNLSGVTRTEEEFQVWMTWGGKVQPLSMTDDLGNTHSVIIQSFKPSRSKTYVNMPWRVNYQAQILVLS